MKGAGPASSGERWPHGASAVATSVGTVVDRLVTRTGRFRTPGGSEPG